MKPIVVVVGRRPTPPLGSGTRAIHVSRPALADAAKEAMADGHDRIGIAGSDADVATVAGVTARSSDPVPIAILADGDLSRMFAFAASDGHRRLVEGDPYAIDLGVAVGTWGERVFVSSVVCGLPAASPRLFAATPVRRGTVTVLRERPRRIERALGLLVMNSQVWNRMPVAPRATLMDGRLDVQVLTPRRSRLSSLGAAMATGSHLRRRDVTRLATPRAAVEVPARWKVRVDGVTLGRGGFTFETLPSSARLLI